MRPEAFKDILYEKDDASGIVTVTLNQPKRKNAMSMYTFWELWQAVDIMGKDDTAWAMIITGAKDPSNDDPSKECFSSGGYINLAVLQEIDPEIMKEIEMTDIAQKKLTLKFFQLEKPVIAAINGLAIGAGFTMPLSCADLIYASEHAWIRLPFVRLGILPEFASAYLLPRLMGFQRAKEIVYFGRSLSAKEAYEQGLINKVLPHDELLPYATEMAKQLIPPAGPGLAVRLTKRAFHRPYIEAITRSLDIENEGLNKAVMTKDFAEATQARREKREPVYKGQ